MWKIYLIIRCLCSQTADIFFNFDMHHQNDIHESGCINETKTNQKGRYSKLRMSIRACSQISV